MIVVNNNYFISISYPSFYKTIELKNRFWFLWTFARYSNKIRDYFSLLS